MTQKLFPSGTPPFGVGTLHWGTRVSVPEAHRLLDEALEQGLTFIDTANNYAFWEPGGTGNESEACLGDWISRAGSSGRDRLTLATKIGARPVENSSGFGAVEGLSREAVLRQAEESLRRLNTDRVDMLYAHIDDTKVPLAETVGALQEVVERGWATRIGASNLTAARLREALDLAGEGPRYAAVQNRCTLLVPNSDADLWPQAVLDDAVAGLAAEEHILAVGYSPLLSGAYTQPEKPLPPEYRRLETAGVLAVLDTVVRSTGLDAGQVVLAWLRSKEHPVLPLVGISRSGHLTSALKATAQPLGQAETALLSDARTPQSSP